MNLTYSSAVYRSTEQSIGMGNRLSEVMNEKFREMVETGVTIPTLTHYVKHVESSSRRSCY